MRTSSNTPSVATRRFETLLPDCRLGISWRAVPGVYATRQITLGPHIQNHTIKT